MVSLIPSIHCLSGVQSQQPIFVSQVFVLGDTSYSPCCVDEVAASHLDAEIVIHFGPTCLTPTSKLPIYFAFGRCQVDVDALANEVTWAVPYL